MSKAFKNIYKDIMNPMPSLPLYGLGELVVYDGLRWEVTGFEPDEKEGCWVFDLKAVDGSNKKKTGIHELGLMKSYAKAAITKEQVAAIVRNMLGKNAQDEDFTEKVRMYLEKLGIASAGPVPNSLLARQDLEPETRKGIAVVRKSAQTYAVWYYDSEGAQKCATYNNLSEAEAFAAVLEALDCFTGIKILTKGQVEQTGKQLDRLAVKAEDAETDEKKSIVENIKAIQLRRQKATINARKTQPTFSAFWREKGKK